MINLCVHALLVFVVFPEELSALELETQVSEVDIKCCGHVELSNAPVSQHELYYHDVKSESECNSVVPYLKGPYKMFLPAG